MTEQKTRSALGAWVGLIGAVLFVASIATGAPWWAYWVPLFVLFLVSLLLFAASIGNSMSPPNSNVVDLDSRRPRK